MAAPTVNEKILRASLRHHAEIQRYATDTTIEIIKILNRSDLDITRQIEDRIARLGPVGGQVFGRGKDTTERLQALLLEIQKLNKEAYAPILAELRGRLKKLAVKEAAWIEKTIQDATPIKLSFTRPDARLLASLVNSKPFGGEFLSKSIKGLEAERARALEAALQDGVAQGEAIDQLMRRITGSRLRKGVLKTGRIEAEKIARTYVNHVSNFARKAFHEENADIIKGEMWVATLDTRTCKVCGPRDGKYWPLGKAPAIPAHFNCRCTLIPVLRSWQEMGIDLQEFPEDMRAAMNGAVPGSVTYNDWLRGEDAETQDSVLGKRRGAWFRKFPDKSSQVAWARSFKPRKSSPLPLELIN